MDFRTLIVCNGLDKPCDFAAFMTLVDNGIYNLVLLSTLIVVFMLAWVGYTLLTSGGSTTAYQKGKDMLWKVVWGYVWILAAWLLIYTITNTLLDDSLGFLLGKPKP